MRSSITLRTIRAILESTGAGLVLLSAGCGPEPVGTNNTGFEPDGSTLASSLTPYPDTTCEAPAQQVGGFYGSCCTHPLCYEPAEGEDCLPAGAVGAANLAGFPPGSGSCQCGVTSGPYAPRERGQDSCCYLVGSIACDGRPLRTPQGDVLASIVVRRDWIS